MREIEFFVPSMTTNTPPASPSGNNQNKRSKSSSSTASAGSKKKTQEPLMETEVSAASGRFLRHAGFTGESSLARPVLIDDIGLVPEEHRENTSFTLNLRGNEKEKKVISVEGETDRLELFARGVSDQKRPFKYAVAIVPSNEDEPIRVWNAEILTSERRVKRTKEVEETDAARLGVSATGNIASASSAALDYKTSQNLLGEAFGTRKRKQAIASLEKNKVRADGISAPATEFISQTLADSKEEFPEQAVAAASKTENIMASSLLPPYDKLTLNVLEIYPISTLIPAECYKALPVEDFVGLSVKSSKEEIENMQYKYGMKDFWMNRILCAPRDDGNHAVRLLLFGHFLSSFRELKEAAINGPDGSVVAVQSRLFECPENVVIDLLNRFADRIDNNTATSTSSLDNSSNSNNFLGNCKHKLPNMLRDKAILYLLVVVLHLDNFRASATSISELLALSPTKIVSFFRALGCTIDRPNRGEESNVIVNNRLVPIKYVRLTAPLTFPPPPKRQGKK